MPLTIRSPSPELRPYVRRYAGYEEKARDVRTLREIPSGDVPVILSVGPALAITDPGADEPVLRRSFVAGVHDRYALTEVPRHQHGLELRLTPIGAYTLLAVPMHMLANRAVELADLLGSFAEQLVERLHSLPDWSARFDYLDRSLTDLLARGRAPSPSTVRAWGRLEETSGRLPIASLAAELGASRKHLAERFREEIGVPPKTLARVLRFRRAVRLLQETTCGIGEIARTCGYSDQAHLSRDFRQLAGVTPGTVAAKPPVS